MKSSLLKISKIAALFVAVGFTCFQTLTAQQGRINPDTLKKYILTPPPKETPRINGAKVFGVRPGSVFFYTIPATGKRPMTFSAVNLPKGLKLDAQTGRITGSVKKAGTYRVSLKATNALGNDEREFRIIAGDQIGLTPAMGWNSWNCWGEAIDREKVLAAAKAMVETDLINHGWSYINIDDGWQAIRGGKYNGIQPNKKFPDMKGLFDQVHGMGLRIGIYSGPWVGTYAGFVGSYSDNPDGTSDWINEPGTVDEHYRYIKPNANGRRGHGVNYHHGKYSFVKNDVRQWMDWGIDYLKYDWNPNDYYHVKEMHDALREQKRDVLFSMSNSGPYGDAMMFEKYANVWRTTGDIRDNWDRIKSLGFSQTKWAPFVGPGHFADPDMLVVGYVGWGPNLHYTALTPDQQYTHISLWSMLCSPLLLGCDLSRLDEFTLSLLTNDEVIEVNQDPLGKMAMPIIDRDGYIVYQKPLEDGSVAMGIFNLNDHKIEVTVTWSNLGIRGTQKVRDLWRQQDIAESDREFKTAVNPHGVVLVRIYPGNSRIQATSGR
ncbi:MAG: putative Ig domain-containing protein [Tannerella sp.]|jgi:alpha-galactosidase|nr:putative Ig domain-containing protein [Tannerella sp.]